MSMLDPGTFIEMECRGKSYRELLEIRDGLLKEIRAFEEDRLPPQARMILPSPEVRYQVTLEYLGELFKLIAETYREERLEKEEE